MSLQETGLKILNYALEAVSPAALFRKSIRFENGILSIDGSPTELEKYRKIYIVGAGKAAGFMAKEFEKILGEKITEGIVSVKYGHKAGCVYVTELEAGHPLTDTNGIINTSRILSIADKASRNDLVLCLLSGGGSALLEQLPDGITPKLYASFIERLLRKGIGIKELNVIRTGISLVKGGKLAARIFPADCVTVIISDVIGSQPRFIASGPTFVSNTDEENIHEILLKYDMTGELPFPVINHFKESNRNTGSENLKLPLSYSDKCYVIGDNDDALASARKSAEESGYNVFTYPGKIEGEASAAAELIAGCVKNVITNNFPAAKPACLIFGGETTVTVKGEGKGGRNQELALAALIQLKDIKTPFLLISCGTDGTDGPTDAAGAFINNEMTERTARLGLNPAEFLSNNDSYNFFSKTSGLIITGPTGTNVMDIVIALIP